MSRETVQRVVALLLSYALPWCAWLAIWHYEQDRVERLEFLMVLVATYAFNPKTRRGGQSCP